MKKLYQVRLFLFIYCMGMLTTPLDAQKLSKKVLRSMRRQQAAEAALTSSAVTQHTLQTTACVQQAVRNAERQTPRVRPVGTALSAESSSVLAQKAVFSLLRQKAHRNSENPLLLLDPLWKQQEKFPNVPLFPLFMRRYYSKQFGDLSPHMGLFFDQVGSCYDPDLEFRITKRLYYLAQNKYIMANAALPGLLENNPSIKSFRVRYLKNIADLTPETFDEKNLVLSIEQRMSANPYYDFPIRHVNGRSKVKIGQQTYPVFTYNGPFDNLSVLYRFLLNGAKPHQHISLLFDEEGQSLAMFNHDRSLWLRISPHEFTSPDRLHIHLNELRPTAFVNRDGAEKTETVNLNLSIPLTTPPGLPKYRPRDFLYKKMILDPVKAFKQDAHITIEKRPIW